MSSHSTHMTLKPNQELEGLVVVVSKKTIRMAAQRNKLRRRIKEIIRVEHKEILDKPLKGYLYTRKGIGTLTFQELKKEVLELIKEQ